MPQIIEWPDTLKIVDRADPHLAFNTRSGGVSLGGTEQIISPLSERWEWSISTPIRNVETARALRGVKTRLQGRFNYLLIRLCDQYRITRRDVDAFYAGGSPVSHSDGSFFSDGSGYALAEPISPVVTAAAKNSTGLTVRASDLAGSISAGVFFSVDYYLYHVDSWELVGDNYVLEISPPLREAVAVDAEADFSALSLWQLGTDDAGTTDLRSGRFGLARLSLVEPVGR